MTFPTITPSDWRLAITRGRTEPNAVSEQIRAAVAAIGPDDDDDDDSDGVDGDGNEGTTLG